MIRTLIFDFAGVVTTAAIFPAAAEVLGKRSGLGKEAFYRRLLAGEREYLIGNSTTEKFWEDTCKGTGIPYDEFVEEISRYEIDDDVLELVRGLKGKYRLVLLSDNYDALFERISGDERLKGIFDHAFYSHQLSMVKLYDEDRIFDHVLKALGIRPGECVFIDDNEKNLVSPKRMGIHTILFRDAAELRKELAGLGVAQGSR